MPFWVFACEDFPAKATPESPSEYIQVLGHQVGPIKARVWFKLNQRYERKYFTDFMDRHGRADTNLADEVAEAIAAKYGFRGVVVREFDSRGPQSASQLVVKKAEEEAETKYKSWLKQVVERWERLYRKAVATGNGRMDPSEYEIRAYKALDMTPPDSVEAFQQSRKPQPVAVEVKMPDMGQMFAQFLSMLQNVDDDTMLKLRTLKGGAKKQVIEAAVKAAAASGEIEAEVPLKTPTVFDENLAETTEAIEGESVSPSVPAHEGAVEAVEA